jgi:hypothetical protein
MEAAERSIRELLNAYFFFIPRFQRPYSWEPEQVEELWEDAVQGSSGDYFLGSMVVYKRSEDTVAVIDGQQRLTTLLMLLCAIRNAAETAGYPALASGTHTFIERKDENNEDRFVLATETSYPFLHAEILSRQPARLDQKGGREEEAIRDAFKRLVKYVSETVAAIEANPSVSANKRSAEVGSALKKLRDKVLSIRVIFVVAPDQDDATTIFVTMNSRGKDLEPADLIKAHLLHLLPKKQHLDEPRLRWEKIVDDLDAADPPLQMTEFLLASWRSRYGPTSANRLHKDVRREIKQAGATRFLGELALDSKRYLHANDPATTKWPPEAFDAAESLGFLSEFGIRQPMPLLLAVVREYEEKGISTPQLVRVLRAVEDFVFTWTVLANKTSSGGMSLLYGRHARDLLHASDRNAKGLVIGRLVRELGQRRPLEAEFDDAFKALWLTDDRPGKRKIVQYALRRIYRFESGQSGAPIDFSRMTIEHLAPQGGGTANCGLIGNLVYVSTDLNGRLGNRDWAAKRSVLASATEWIPPEVKVASTWNDSSIQGRSQRLAELGRTKIWIG